LELAWRWILGIEQPCLQDLIQMLNLMIFNETIT
jgi:hypothetical protein